ncbi:hypothetical protein [Halalkalicoccus salilacus]|uniref:hypothetical protein n=1 Tax=Halalkalicoccus sp. GCM10025704 TaxID=3252662 RepID=UPI0036150815
MVAVAPGDRDRSAVRDHPRTRGITTLDRAFQPNVETACPHRAHSGDAGFERRAGVAHLRERQIHVARSDDVLDGRLAGQREVNVRVNQPRNHRVTGKRNRWLLALRLGVSDRLDPSRVGIEADRRLGFDRAASVNQPNVPQNH